MTIRLRVCAFMAFFGATVVGFVPVCSAAEMIEVPRDYARPLIKEKLCRGNKQAGIGVEDHSDATFLDNKCATQVPAP